MIAKTNKETERKTLCQNSQTGFTLKNSKQLVSPRRFGLGLGLSLNLVLPLLSLPLNQSFCQSYSDSQQTQPNQEFRKPKQLSILQSLNLLPQDSALKPTSSTLLSQQRWPSYLSQQLRSHQQLQQWWVANPPEKTFLQLLQNPTPLSVIQTLHLTFSAEINKARLDSEGRPEIIIWLKGHSP